MNEIIHASDIDGFDPEECPDIAAIKEPEGTGMEFHVQMRGYTLREMDELIVNAAAQMIVGRSSGDKQMSKDIEARCQALILQKINAKLATVTAEIIDQPLTPAWVGKDKPVTMREAIGLTVREYLHQQVDRAGKPSTDYYSKFGTMLEWIVWNQMSSKFKNEIDAATNAAISEMQKTVKAEQAKLIAEQKQRLADAFAKLTA